MEDEIAGLRRQVMGNRGPGVGPDPYLGGGNSAAGSVYPFYPPGGQPPQQQNQQQQQQQQGTSNNGTVHMSVSEHRQLINQNSFLQEEVVRLRAENESLRTRLNEWDGGGNGMRMETDQQQQPALVQQGYPLTGSSQSQPQGGSQQVSTPIRTDAEGSPRQQQGAQPMDEAGGSLWKTGAAPGTAAYSLNAYAGGNPGEN